jgi:hypothetical protein
MARFISILR